MKRIILKTVVSAFLIRRVVTAYIDPNTGGMLFQMLAVLFGLISGLLLFFSGQLRMLFARMKRFVRERQGTLAPDGSGADDRSFSG